MLTLYRLFQQIIYCFPDKPRKTNISIHHTSVKINTAAKFTCLTDANPAPSSYSWFHYKQTDLSQKKMFMIFKETLELETVQRANEGCYICNASNTIDTGDTSKPVCIEVLCKYSADILKFLCALF